MKKYHSSPIVNIFSTILFLVFVFLYLFCFQDDMLVYAQHILSYGTTVYNPLIGAVIITLLLGLLSMLSSRFFTNNLYFIPAIYHLPSMLVLASLTDIRIVEDGSRDVFGLAWIMALILFILLLIVNYMIKGLPINASITTSADLLRSLTLNLAIMLGMMLYVFVSANTNEMDHVVLRQEVLLKQKRYEDAALLAKPQNLSSEHLTTLRAFALSQTPNGIGEHFFEYPVAGNSSALLPTDSNRMLIASEKPIFQFIGGKPAKGMTAKRCLQLLYKRGELPAKAHDYLYLSALLDKDLDGFVNYLCQDSVDVATLPKHYRQALCLYRHLRTNHRIDYVTPEMETDYEDLEDLMKKNPNKTLRENALRDSYGDTYWYYYFTKKQ